MFWEINHVYFMLIVIQCEHTWCFISFEVLLHALSTPSSFTKLIGTWGLGVTSALACGYMTSLW